MASLQAQGNVHHAAMPQNTGLYKPQPMCGPHGIQRVRAMYHSQGCLGFYFFYFTVIGKTMQHQWGEFYHIASGRHLTPVEKLLFQSFPLDQLDLSCLTDRDSWDHIRNIFYFFILGFQPLLYSGIAFHPQGDRRPGRECNELPSGCSSLDLCFLLRVTHALGGPCPHCHWYEEIKQCLDAAWNWGSDGSVGTWSVA